MTSRGASDSPLVSGGNGDIAPISVVIPTIGRPRLLAQALESLSRCLPAPAEVVIVDQSRESASAHAVSDSGLSQARVVHCERRGVGTAMNVGLGSAVHDIVMCLHDDCTANPDWIAAGLHAMRTAPEGMASGQVLPTGPDPRAVPSCLVLDEPRDYTGTLNPGVLFPCNMVAPRQALIDLGGFDERIPYAEDLDLCYRWLRAGNQFRHVPEMIVEHHDWRTHEELCDLYVGYGYGQGMFYAKHLRAHDMGVLRLLAKDAVSGTRSFAARVIYGRPRWADARRGMVRGLPGGIRRGWTVFGSESV